MNRLQQLRVLKSDWNEREYCPLCKGSGIDEDNEECLNCDGVGVVPTASWDDANKELANEWAELEATETRLQEADRYVKDESEST